MLHPKQTAYRQGYCAQRVSLDRAVELEHAMQQGHALTQVSLDLAKAFDRVPHNLLLKTCGHFRMPARVLGLLGSKVVCSEVPLEIARTL